MTDGSGHSFGGGFTPTMNSASPHWAGVSRLTYDLIFANDLETAPRGCLPPDCN